MNNGSLSAPRHVLLILLFLLLLQAAGTIACGQTVLSPPPLMTLQDRMGIAGPLPASVVEIKATDDPAEDPAAEKSFRMPVIFNESVESQIEYFTTKGRTVFQSWLRRSARYIPIMKKIFREHNLPEDLVYVAMIESGFNPQAVSPKKAVGPWQFMRATAREYGLNTDRWVDERKDPIKSTHAAAAHFKDLYAMFGSWPLVLASYNAGMGRLQGAVHKANSDDYWELSRILHQETQEYVPKYLAAMIIAKDPVSYGFRDPQEEPFAYDEVEVAPSTDLRAIAVQSGCSYQEIRDLNPELLLSTTPKSRYVLRLPQGTKETVTSTLALASRREKQSRGDRARARSGGLLYSRIASAYHRDFFSPAPRSTVVPPFKAQLELHPVSPEISAGAVPAPEALNRKDGDHRAFP